MLLSHFWGIRVATRSRSVGIPRERKRGQVLELLPAATDRRTLMATVSCTCAAPWRNMPIALRPARNSATSTFPSLLVSSLSNRSWYDLSLSASQHRAVGRKNLRMFWYIVALTGKQRRRSGCDLRIHCTDRLRRPAEKKSECRYCSPGYNRRKCVSGGLMLQVAPCEGGASLPEREVLQSRAERWGAT